MSNGEITATNNYLFNKRKLFTLQLFQLSLSNFLQVSYFYMANFLHTNFDIAATQESHQNPSKCLPLLEVFSCVRETVNHA